MNNNYLTVSEINKYIKSKFDNDPELGLVYLKGEVSNFKFHTTGHLYFTVKDENARILAVMFNGSARGLKFTPKDGDRVLIIGKISVYEASGNYQIYVNEMALDGVGNLYLEFEKLKKKLSEKGYFDESLKQPIPKFPKKIGVITASTGAAVRDILTTINRRYPLVEVIVFPSLVQGIGAKEDITKNINIANSYDLDVIILGRGGGSIEDLWAFNEEIVADAIYKSSIPIISAVGHEIDFTISDFVADLRAPTPTAAAELAVPNITQLQDEIKNYKIRASRSIVNTLKSNKEHLSKLLNSYVLKNPLNIYEVKTQKLDILITRLFSSIERNIERNKHKYLNIISKLEPLNPILTLKRGYSITELDGKTIVDVKNIKIDDVVETNVSNGSFTSKIIDIKKEKK
ncbi:MAG TPA: exodeoxyribonuclease VII large subunit [Bacilli bacterium]|nr:exodeoxyribonuclease VII large subunit [Bacilli bacterium]